MWLTKLIQKLQQKSEPIKPKLKTLKDLDYLDSVWIKEDDEIFEGWVFDFTRRCIIVVYGHDLRDFRFRMEKPFNRTEIQQNDKTLYCNEPEEPYIRIKE